MQISNTQPVNQLSDHEHEVWLAAYLRSYDAQPGVLVSERAEGAAYAALKAYRKVCEVKTGEITVPKSSAT